MGKLDWRSVDPWDGVAKAVDKFIEEKGLSVVSHKFGKVLLAWGGN